MSSACNYKHQSSANSPIEGGSVGTFALPSSLSTAIHRVLREQSPLRRNQSLQRLPVIGGGVEAGDVDVQLSNDRTVRRDLYRNVPEHSEALGSVQALTLVSLLSDRAPNCRLASFCERAGRRRRPHSKARKDRYVAHAPSCLWVVCKTFNSCSIAWVSSLRFPSDHRRLWITPVQRYRLQPRFAGTIACGECGSRCAPG